MDVQKQKFRTKNTGIRDGEDREERSEDVIYRRILRISEA